MFDLDAVNICSKETAGRKQTDYQGLENYLEFSVDKLPWENDMLTTSLKKMMEEMGDELFKEKSKSKRS